MFTQVVYAEVWLADTWFCISETLKIMIWLRFRLYLCFADYLSCKEADLFLHLGGFYNSFLEKVMKGFMIVMWKRVSLYSLCLIGLSMPQESQAPCAQPVCRCPVMGLHWTVFCVRGQFEYCSGTCCNSILELNLLLQTRRRYPLSGLLCHWVCYLLPLTAIALEGFMLKCSLSNRLY